MSSSESTKKKEEAQDKPAAAADMEGQMRQTNTQRMNMTGQSFTSASNMKSLDEGRGQIRSITGAAETIKKHIKSKLKEQQDDAKPDHVQQDQDEDSDEETKVD